MFIYVYSILYMELGDNANLIDYEHECITKHKQRTVHLLVGMMLWIHTQK